MLWRSLRRLVDAAMLVLVVVFGVNQDVLGVSALAARDGTPLQLEVFINGNSTNLIGAFVALPDGGLAASSSELGELGIAVPERLEGQPIVLLEDIPGLTYEYIHELQRVAIRTNVTGMKAKILNATQQAELPPVSPAPPGILINYSLYGGTTTDFKSYATEFNGASAMLDARIFGSYGTLSIGGIARAFGAFDNDLIRLETAWTYANQDDLMIYRLGDTMSGGLAWTRPIRMAGIQVQRDFGLRPDLITMPLPAVSGSAVVPSTVDVYVNNTKIYTSDVAAGPFEITDIPVVSGAGVAQVVVRDAAGRETHTSAPIYASSKLLRPGLYEFSLEAGVARHNYGLTSGDYSDKPMLSASSRYGFQDWLTLEGHAELAQGLINMGLGFTMPVFHWGRWSSAASLSRYEGKFGAQVYAALEFQGDFFDGHISTQRTLGLYSDMGTVAGRELIEVANPAVWFLNLASVRPPEAVDQISLGFPFLFDDTRLAFNLTHLKRGGDDSNVILSAVHSRPLPLYNLSLMSTAFVDLVDGGAGGYLGMSMPLGRAGTATASVNSDGSGSSFGIEHTKARGMAPGDVGWQVRVMEGATPQHMAAVSYRASRADFQGRINQFDRSIAASAEMQGSVVVAAGDVFFTSPITDAFAVVDAGAPNIDVFHENRYVATTGPSGVALVTGMQSHQPAKLSIDPLELPIDTEIERAEMVVVPAYRSGAFADFGIRQSPHSAVLVLRAPDQSFLPAGSRGRFDGQADDFVVGYSGEAFVSGLSTTNLVEVDLPDGRCHAAFDFIAQSGVQTKIDPVICR